MSHLSNVHGVGVHHPAHVSPVQGVGVHHPAHVLPVPGVGVHHPAHVPSRHAHHDVGAVHAVEVSFIGNIDNVHLYSMNRN